MWNNVQITSHYLYQIFYKSQSNYNTALHFILTHDSTNCCTKDFMSLTSTGGSISYRQSCQVPGCQNFWGKDLSSGAASISAIHTREIVSQHYDVTSSTHMTSLQIDQSEASIWVRNLQSYVHGLRFATTLVSKLRLSKATNHNDVTKFVHWFDSLVTQ